MVLLRTRSLVGRRSARALLSATLLAACADDTAGPEAHDDPELIADAEPAVDALALPDGGGASFDDELLVHDIEEIEPNLDLAAPTSPTAITVSDVTNYCSVSYSTGGWVFVWGAGDQCARAGAGPGRTIARKGIISTSGLNHVVARCSDGAVWVYSGYGGAGLQNAFSAASGHPNCVFIAAPAALPVFDAPFDITTAKFGGVAGNYTGGNGFDHWYPAQSNVGTIDVTQFGQSGGAAKVVDRWGKKRDTYNGGGADGHPAYDFGIDTGTPLKAVGAGTVLKAWQWANGSCTPDQKEVYIEHEVCGASGYCEYFVSVYVHLDSFSVATGDTVTKGQVIGYSGSSGCTGTPPGPHLHFQMHKSSNTPTALKANYVLSLLNSPPHNFNPFAIDPFGWTPPTGFDPWAWLASGMGQISTNVWTQNSKTITRTWQ